MAAASHGIGNFEKTVVARLDLAKDAMIETAERNIHVRKFSRLNDQGHGNQKAPAHIIGIEPVSHRWVLRDELEAAGEFNWLKPGESRSYELRFAFVQ